MLEIHFGALAPTLKEQLEEVEINEHEIEHFQKDADAIVRLSVRGLIPDSVKVSAYKKLMGNLTEAIKKQYQLEPEVKKNGIYKR